MLLALSVLKQQKGVTGSEKARGKRDCKAVWPVSLVWEWPKFWPTGCYIPNIASGVPGTVPYPLGYSFTREAVSMGLNPQGSFLLHKWHRISLGQLKLIPRLSVFAVYANRFWLIDFLPRAFFANHCGNHCVFCFLNMLSLFLAGFCTCSSCTCWTRFPPRQRPGLPSSFCLSLWLYTVSSARSSDYWCMLESTRMYPTSDTYYFIASYLY